MSDHCVGKIEKLSLLNKTLQLEFWINFYVNNNKQLKKPIQIINILLLNEQ